MNPLQLQNIHFGYAKEKTVLNGLNLSVPPASIYGFLGPNGAGKSTTIRILLGLLRPRSGDVLLWEEPLQKVVPSIYKRIGALVEAPSFYPQLSAQDNLRLVGKYQGGVSAKSTSALLERVGLAEHKQRAVRKFSTGMKQRLGLAMAMLYRPELLVLDEPTNGLDPVGISEIRHLMLELQQEGTTIFLSSHLLSEVEKVASQVGILRRGELAFEGSIEDLQNLRAQQLQLWLRVNKQEGLTELFDKASFELDGQIIRMSIQSEEEIPGILSKLITAGYDVYEATPKSSGLEELFMQITHQPIQDEVT